MYSHASQRERLKGRFWLFSCAPASDIVAEGATADSFGGVELATALGEQSSAGDIVVIIPT
jgi:hypothetical protein